MASFISTFSRVEQIERAGTNPLSTFRDYATTGIMQSSTIKTVLVAFLLSVDGVDLMSEDEKGKFIEDMIIHDGTEETAYLAGSLLAIVVSGTKKKAENQTKINQLRKLIESSGISSMQGGLLLVAASLTTATLAVGIMKLFVMLGI